MSEPRAVLLLHAPGERPPDLDGLAEGLESAGARVVVRPVAEPMEELLAAIAAADTVLYWN